MGYYKAFMPCFGCVTGILNNAPITIKLIIDAITALRITISHCALPTIGFSIGVRGDANAGTAETFRNLSRHAFGLILAVGQLSIDGSRVGTYTCGGCNGS